MSEQDEFGEMLKAQTLAAFGLKPWDIGGPVPRRVRFWRAVTFAYRRGKAVDWRSYEVAEAQAQQRNVEFRAGMDARVQEVADQISEGLPGGLRFEWAPDGE